MPRRHRQARLRRQTGPRIENDAQRRPIGQPGQTAAEIRVVRHRGLGTDQNGIVQGTQVVAVLAGCRPGDPLALASRRGDPAVERACDLQMEKRPAGLHPRQEAGIDLGRLGGPLAHGDLDACRPQPFMSPPLHPWIGVLERRDDLGDAGRDQGVGTGRRAAMMRARFERDVGRGALQRDAECSGLRDGIGFGVRPPPCLGTPARNDPAVAHDDAAHGGIGPGAPERSARQR